MAKAKPSKKNAQAIDHNSTDSPAQYFWRKYPRLTLLLYCVVTAAGGFLLGGQVADRFRSVQPPEPVRQSELMHGVSDGNIDIVPDSQLSAFRAGAILYSTYYWTERGASRAGGSDQLGEPFVDGFGRARAYLSHDLPQALSAVGVRDVGDMLRPAMKAVEARDRQLAQEELNNVVGRVSSFLEGKEATRPVSK